VSLSLQVVAQAQLAQWRRDGEQRDRSFQKLMEEMENLKNQLAASSARCQLLEGRAAQVRGWGGGSWYGGGVQVSEELYLEVFPRR